MTGPLILVSQQAPVTAAPHRRRGHIVVGAFRIGLLALWLSVLSGLGHDPASWMAAINGDKWLSELAIPGTHDSGACRDPIYGPGTTKCQALSIASQLYLGIRFLDIRCRNREGKFQIYHGCVNQCLSFDNVIKNCYTFLQSNQSECVIMSIQEDCDSSFEDTFDSYTNDEPTRWYLKPYIPKLAEVRGKIVLLRRFSARHLPKGIDAHCWPENKRFTIKSANAHLEIQDIYKIHRVHSKMEEIRELYDDSAKGQPTWLYINFASGYKPILWIPRIQSGYVKINSVFKGPLPPGFASKRAITIFDFADWELASRIFEQNDFP